MAAEPPRRRTGRTPPPPLDRRRSRVLARRRIPSRRDAIGPEAETLMRLLEALGFGEEERTDLEIALREALANAVIHGNREDPAKRVFLRAYADPDGVLVLVRDQGKGFDPDRVPDPTRGDRLERASGRGIYLMRQLTDRLGHRRGGREVWLYKRKRKGKPPARRRRKRPAP